MIIKHLYSCQLILNNLNKIKKGLYNISSGKSTPIENDDIHILPYNLTYYILTNNSLKGAIDKDFSVILPTEYDDIYNYNKDSLVVDNYNIDSLVVVKKDKSGLLDKNFNKIFETEYTLQDMSVGRDRNNSIRYYMLNKDGICSIYGQNRKKVKSYTLQGAYPIGSYNDKDNLIIFIKNNKSGIMNAMTGEILVKPIYDELQFYNFYRWYLVSSLNKKFGRIYIKNGKINEMTPIYDKLVQNIHYNSTYTKNTNTNNQNFTWYLNDKKFKWDDKDQKFLPYDKIDEPQGARYREEISSVTDDYDKINEIYIIPEAEASFVGQNGESFEAFVIKNMKYPQEAIDNKIEGTVELIITIEPISITINKSLGYGCDEEAVRIIGQTSLSYWKPAKFDTKFHKNNKNETFASIKRLKIVFKLPKK